MAIIALDLALNAALQRAQLASDPPEIKWPRLCEFVGPRGAT